MGCLVVTGYHSGDYAREAINHPVLHGVNKTVLEILDGESLQKRVVDLSEQRSSSKDCCKERLVLFS